MIQFLFLLVVLRLDVVSCSDSECLATEKAQRHIFSYGEMVLTAKYEDHVRLDPEKGEYSDILFDEPMILLSGVSFKAFYNRLWSILSTGAITLFYEIGCELGRDVMTKLLRKSGNLRKASSVGTNHYYFIGMGKIEVNILQLLKMVATKSLTVRIRNNFPALVIGRTGRTECHLTRGYLVGAVEVMTRRYWSCEETKCRCKDDLYCEFKLTMETESSGQRA